MLLSRYSPTQYTSYTALLSLATRLLFAVLENWISPASAMYLSMTASDIPSMRRAYTMALWMSSLILEKSWGFGL